MINVIHVLTDTNIGGAGIVLLNTLRSFNREKINIKVILPTSSLLIPKVKELHVNIIELDNISDKSFSLSAINKFKQIFKKEKPDIIHTHSSLSARIAGKMLKIPVVNTRHCIEPQKNFPIKQLYKIVNNSLSNISIGVSQAVINNLIDDGIKKEKTRLLYNGCYPLSQISEAKKQELLRTYNISSNDVVIGTVGRLETVKNQTFLIDAISDIIKEDENIKLFIVGTGSLEKQLKNKAAELNLNNHIIFTGYLDDISPIISILDIFVLTSVSEALPLSIIEAMTLKKPCISTEVGGISEIITNKETGLIIKNGNLEEFILALKKLINSKTSRETMGKKGEAVAKEKFSIQTMANGLLNIYEELVPNKGDETYE